MSAEKYQNILNTLCSPDTIGMVNVLTLAVQTSILL